jgi:uncharacterized protein YdeI (YjbR/CyaY-like superfamily)
MDPSFFASPTEFRSWLAAHHASETELLVGFFRRASGRPSITWDEAVDEALCFGWIDGVRRALDDEAYTIRFTPRRPGSNWSALNVRRVGDLEKRGRMTPAGRAAFEARAADPTGVYSFEQATPAELTPEEERDLRANAAAAAYFDARPPWYRRAALHWVVSAKRPETRARRLAQLIADSAAGRTVPPLTRPGQKRTAKG